MAEYLPTFVSPEGEARTLAAYDAVLRRWSAPCTELDIPTSLGLTHVIASGEEGQPPLVLLHAFFATAAVWYPNVGQLSEHFRTYAVDVIGEPNKSRPTQRMTRLEQYIPWFGELLDGLGIGETAVAGNSIGGFWGTYAAMSLPSRVRRLVLIGPSATFHQIMPFYYHMFLPKMAYVFLPKLTGLRRTIRRGIRWVHAGLPYDGLWSHLFYQNMLYGAGVAQVFPKVFTRDELAKVKAPTLLLVGEREKIYRPEAVIKAAKGLMPGIETAMIPGAHHITALAQPQLVNEHIIRFCKATPEAQGIEREALEIAASVAASVAGAGNREAVEPPVPVG